MDGVEDSAGREAEHGLLVPLGGRGRAALATPHDALFRHVFAEPRNAAALLALLLPPRMVAAIDWSTLVECPNLLVDLQLSRHEADLLFAAELIGGRELVFLLVEHKSSQDPFTVLQSR